MSVATEISAPPAYIARRTLAMAILAVQMVVAFMLELLLRPVSLGLRDIVVAAFGNASQAAEAIITQIRLPRVMIGLCVGVGLALAGSSMQGMLRNPLADLG